VKLPFPVKRYVVFPPLFVIVIGLLQLVSVATTLVFVLVAGAYSTLQLSGILFSTVRVAVADFILPRRSLRVRVRAAVPACFPSTSPVELTVATAGLLLLRVRAFEVAWIALKKVGLMVARSQVVGVLPVVVRLRVVPVMLRVTVRSVSGS
jgi:hypothetical protein